MTATFETKINAIRTGTVGELTNVVKRVEFSVKGTEQGQSFELPQSIEIADPDPVAFIQLANVTEANVIQWVNENFTNMAAAIYYSARPSSGRICSTAGLNRS